MCFPCGCAYDQNGLSEFDATRNSRVSQLKASKGAFAALTKAGAVYAWGDESTGELLLRLRSPPLSAKPFTPDSREGQSCVVFALGGCRRGASFARTDERRFYRE